MPEPTHPPTLTRDQWVAEARRRFGPDPLNWRFVCPACGHIASACDWRDAGAPEGAVGFSCVGRWLPTARDAFAKGPGPCNYAGGGLIGLNPVRVVHDGETHDVFTFADPCCAPEADDA